MGSRAPHTKRGSVLYRRVIKRLLDIVVGIIALPFVVLALLVLAPLIHREDKGPVFYNASRVGRDGRPFVMYKLRSMRLGAPDLKMPDGSTYNGADDPRQTRIGAFLRRTSLDELPQLLNVLKGDMSLIGPRPDLAEEVALYEGDEGRKLKVRPGISGYAQVYGRNAIVWRDRLALDGYYVDHQSFLLDARVFLKTFAVVFSQEGIYVEASGDGAGDGGTTASDDEAAPGDEAGDGGTAAPDEATAPSEATAPGDEAASDEAAAPGDGATAASVNTKTTNGTTKENDDV